MYTSVHTRLSALYAVLCLIRGSRPLPVSRARLHTRHTLVSPSFASSDVRRWIARCRVERARARGVPLYLDARACVRVLSGLLFAWTAVGRRNRIRLMNTRAEASQGDRDGVRGCYYGPLRCSDVPLYDSVVDSHAHRLSFPPTLAVVGALMLKRLIVQYGSTSNPSEQKSRISNPS